MNSPTTDRGNYVRLALFSFFAVVLGVAIWRAGFATTSPFVNSAEAQSVSLTLE